MTSTSALEQNDKVLVLEDDTNQVGKMIYGLLVKGETELSISISHLLTADYS